jgi:hypothetical protein
MIGTISFALLGAAAQDPAARPTEKMLAREPGMVLESLKGADALQDCIGLALKDLGRPVAVRDQGRRYVGFRKIDQNVLLITIYETDPRRIEVRWTFAFNKKWRNRIRFCAT